METLLTVVTTGLVFILGAAVGSFLNVVIYRLPTGLSLLHPPSHCPKCSHRLGITENIPILGWLKLKGRCHWCKAKISLRYPAVELLTGLLFCFIFGHLNGQITLTTVGYWIFLSWLLALALIDFDTMTLPNVLTQSGLVLGLVFQGLRGWQEGQFAHYLMLGISSAVLGIWLFDLISWVGTIALGQTAMGGGDPKLAAMIGAWLGWQALLVTGFVACGVGSVIGILAMMLGRLQRRQAMPFGPFLVLATILTVFWGDTIISSYKAIFFPLL